MKRQGLALAVVLALVATSGCLAFALGGTLEMEADPAGVDQATLEETGFVHNGTDRVSLEQNVTVAGRDRQINATNWIARYERPTDLQAIDGQTGGFVVVSTPDVTVAGRSVNPVAGMSDRELLAEFRGELESEVGTIRDVRRIGERTEPVLGYAATVTTFAAETDVEGETVTVNVHVTRIAHENDLVVAIGVHPEALQQQAPEIHALMRAIEHPVEA